MRKKTKYFCSLYKKIPVIIIFTKRTFLGILKIEGSQQGVHWVSRPCFATKIPHYSLDWSENNFIQFSSVTQSCPTLCNPMNYSTPGLPVHHQLLEFTQTHVHPVVHPAISSSVVPFSSCSQSLTASESFPMSQLFTRGGQSIGVSALASVLSMNTLGWSPLGWTGWISLQSKGLSRVFSNTIVQKHQFFGAQLSSRSNSHIHRWPMEKP